MLGRKIRHIKSRSNREKHINKISKLFLDDRIGYHTRRIENTKKSLNRLKAEKPEDKEAIKRVQKDLKSWQKGTKYTIRTNLPKARKTAIRFIKHVNGLPGTEEERNKVLANLASSQDIYELEGHRPYLRLAARHQVPATTFTIFKKTVSESLKKAEDAGIKRSQALSGIPSPLGSDAGEKIASHVEGRIARRNASERKRTEKKKVAELKEIERSLDSISTKGSENWFLRRSQEQLMTEKKRRKELSENAMQNRPRNEPHPDSSIRLVRMTDNIPKDGVIYPASKYFTEGKGAQRRTIHWVLNGPVDSHMYGNWGGHGVSIVVPYDKAKPWIHNGLPWDVFGVGKFKLPEGSHVLVSKEVAKKEGLKGGERLGNARAVVVDTESIQKRLEEAGEKTESPLQVGVMDFLRKEGIVARRAHQWEMASSEIEKKLKSDGINSFTMHNGHPFMLLEDFDVGNPNAREDQVDKIVGDALKLVPNNRGRRMQEKRIREWGEDIKERIRANQKRSSA